MTFDVQKATEQWLASFEKYGLELVSGEFSFESFLKLLESCPPEVQSNPAKKFEPRRREMIQALKERLFLDAQLSRKPSSPQDSQVQAIAELITKKIGINRSTGEKYVAAAIPLRRAVAKIKPIDDKLLEQFDDHFFAMLKFQECRREFPPGFEDRVRFAVQMNDSLFFVKLGECLSKSAEFSGATDLRDFKLKQLKPQRRFLLENWTQLVGCVDKIGLCDFAWSALHNFLQLRFPQYEGDIREVARYANLAKRDPPQVEQVKQIKADIWQIAKDGSRVRLLCRVLKVPAKR